MKQLSFLFLFLIVVLTACKSGKEEKGDANATTDSTKFYPVGDFFRAQIRYVDLRNFSIYKISTKDGKKDSTVLTKDEFVNWVSQLLARSIFAPKYDSSQYKETVFHDLTTQSLTLNYAPLNRDALVQNIDVLLNDETNIVKTIYIKSIYTNGDTTIVEQCNWKADKSMHQNRVLSTKAGYTSSEINYINWNDKP